MRAATSKTGEVYPLGRHRLLVADCSDRAAVARLMGRERAHALVTDPPYNVGYTGRTSAKLKIAGDRQPERQFREFLHKCFAVADAHLLPGSAFYIWHPAGRPQAFFDACQQVGWPIRQHLVWAKSRWALGWADYHWQHEPCLYGWKPGAPHRWHGDRRQSTLLAYSNAKKNREHPTMKPVAMFERLIANSTAPSELVLDCFAGSGTTVLACENTGRSARVVEIDAHYADVVRRRWAEQLHGAECDWAAITASKATRRRAA